MYRLVFHNGSLSVTGPQKSIKVWYSTAQGMPSKLAESHESMRTQVRGIGR